MNNIFEKRKKTQNLTQVPVWFMRQAGRYHQHYQAIKKNSDFMTMCKNPELACEITLGPIQDFNFDAAILFSDLLFPLEQIGMGLNYLQGPPELAFKLETLNDLTKLKIKESAQSFYQFQKSALEKLKIKLPHDVTLLGFVGAPFTLYTYAVEGSHHGNLVSSKNGFIDGRWESFWEILYPQLIENMVIQAQGGAQAVCLFDTAAGELSLVDYKRYVIPKIRKITHDFKKLQPQCKIIYYSKMTHLHYIHALEDSNIDVLGLDWRIDLLQASKEFSKNYYIQGNIDPAWLHLPWKNLEENLKQFKHSLMNENFNFDKWIAGLGHGVLIKTPEDNVRNTVQWIHENFKY